MGCVILLLAGTQARTFAQGVGTLAVPILRISPNARQVGMGEAFTAMANDYNLLRYNVGGLGILRHVMLTTNYHKWIDDTEQGNIEVSLPIRIGVVGFGLTYFSEGDLREVNSAFQPTGGIASNNDLMLTLGFGSYVKLLGNTLAFGVGGNFIRQDLAGLSGSAIGLDVGVVYAMKNLSFGATLQNFTLTKMQLGDRAELLPETLRGGVALRLPVGQNLKWNIAADAAKIRDEDQLRYYLGTEVRISDLFALRGGYKIHDTEASRWAAGIGLIVPMQWLANSRTEIDYALTPLDAFNTYTHRFSFTFRFGAAQQVGVMAANTEEISRMQRQLSDELRAAEDARRRTEEAEKRTRAIEEEMAQRLKRIQEIALTSAGKIEVIPDADTSRILVSLRINFDFDKAMIRPGEYEIMHKIAEILDTYPESKVWIAGHTDSIGTEEYNIHLSQRRMKSVMDFLIAREGIGSSRFFMPVAYGESRPMADNGTPQGRARNRRVDFTIFTRDSKPEIPQGSAVRAIYALTDTSFAINCNGIVRYETKELQRPYRLIVDFPGIFDLSEQKVYEIQRGIVERARIGYHPDQKFTRVVFDLTRKGRYTTKAVDNTILVFIR